MKPFTLIFWHFLCIKASRIELLLHTNLATLDWLSPDLLMIDFEISDKDTEIIQKLALKGHKIVFSEDFREKGNVLKIQEYPIHNILLYNWRPNYVKDPNTTYLFLIDDLNLIDLNLKINFQPYHFVLFANETHQELFEVQKYSQRIISICSLILKEAKVTFQNQNIFQRRSQFNRARIHGIRDPLLPWFGYGPDKQWIGINGVILRQIKSNFNFSIRWERFKGYGNQLPNGSWIGAMKSLQDDTLDFGNNCQII